MDQTRPVFFTPNKVRAFFYAIIATAAAVAVRLMIQDLAGERVPYGFFFVVVTAVGLYAGLWPALFATLIGGISGYIFIVLPFSKGVELQDIFVLSQFSLVGIIISILCETLHRSEQKIQEDAAMSYKASMERIRLAEELTRTLQAQNEAEEKFRIAQEVSLVSFVFLDAVRDSDGEIVDYKWRYINPAATLILPPKAAVGASVRSAYPPSRSLDDMLHQLNDVISGGQPMQQAFHWDTPEFDGWLDIRAVRVKDGVAVSFFDITKQVHLQKELEFRIAELGLRDRQKDEFLAVLAHELRNPMAPLKNALQILRMAGGRKDIVEDAQQVMERQVDQLVRLVDDLLDVSRITHGKIVLDKCNLVLKDVLNTAIETIFPGIESAHHKLEVNIPPEPVYIYGDQARLIQIFGNILNNAAKYTPAGGRISLTAKADKGTAVVTITDSGVGISPEQMPGIFDMFTQISSVKNRAKGGLGVGLALVQRLVALHGGSVSVSSEGPGKGSTFTVMLPVVTNLAAAPQETPPVHHAHARRRVVIVDDNRDSAQSLGTILELSGAEIHLAYDGFSGFSLIEKIRPDVAILDIGMPGMSGHELARRIRAEEWGKNLHIIALSGWGQKDDKKLSLAAGFDHHLVKPLGSEEIEHILTDYKFPSEGARMH